MPRRFNFTGRKKILRKHIRIQLDCSPGYSPRFDAEFDFNEYSFADDDDIVIYAYTGQSKIESFSFGKCGEIRQPQHTWLNDFVESDDIKFRVLVTAADYNQGLLRGRADGIRPGNLDEDQVSLLSLGRSKLKEECWTLDFPDVATDPVRLLIDEDIRDYKVFASTSEFRGLVLPQVLRQILTTICFRDVDYDRSDSSDWRARWIIFGEGLAGELSDNDNNDAVQQWIDDVVERFVAKAKFKSKLINTQRGS